MSELELEVLNALDLGWTEQLEGVWEPSPFHVDGLHPDASRRILNGIEEATKRVNTNPLGLVLRGQAGAGKTHMLRWARERVHQIGGYFFLGTIRAQTSFWSKLAGDLREGLTTTVRVGPGAGQTQLSVLMNDLCGRAEVTGRVREAIIGERAPSIADLQAFVHSLVRLDRNVASECSDTIRVLALFGSPRLDDVDIASAYLSATELTDEDRRQSGIRTTVKAAPDLVTELSRILALSGPAVLAIDQIDGLIEMAERADDSAAEAGSQVRSIANSLMELYDHTRRTFTILSCLPTSWGYIENSTTDTVPARFRISDVLRNIPDAETASALLRKRFASAYALTGFTPPYPTWPVKPSAMAQARDFTVRQLIRRISEHVDACRTDDVVRIMESLDRPADPGARPDDAAASTRVAGSPDAAGQPLDLEPLDARFEQARSTADVNEPQDLELEDRVLPDLLVTGLNAWIAERASDGRDFRVQRPSSAKRPNVHAQLVEILDEETERERIWSFRGIAATHHRAVQSRLENARTHAELEPGVSDRHLILLRNSPGWPSGKVTDRLVAEIRRDGGLEFPLTAADVRTFAALRALADDRDPRWLAWLRTRKPAHQTELFSRVLGDREGLPDDPGSPLVERIGNAQGSAGESRASNDQLLLGFEEAEAATSADPGTSVSSAASPAARNAGPPVQATAVLSEDPAEASTVLIGTARNRPVELKLESLRRHLLVVAGPGSGKTVLLRRLIEECALCGVSAIVLDGEGDLARMGDAWPADPPGWREGDAERSREYASNVEVVVWTPGKAGGRPLSFRPLPEFPAYDNDGDDFRDAVQAAVASLAPRMFIGKNQKGPKEEAVLRECLEFFGREGGTELDDLRELMRDLPPEASRFGYGPAVAAELAERLEWARVNDPIAAVGEPVDPDRLIVPEGGARARVSIISLVGMPETVQPNFVNQLQLALFSWAQKNPASDGRLRCLLVMDEAQRFVPSRTTTTSTSSTLMLVARARKYGLGMVFATQLPKGLRNEVVSNASTQLLGRVGAGASINAVQELARNRGGEISDVNALRQGEFYLGVEGQQFHKIRTLMCLSHHTGPLEEDEIMRRARGER